MKQIDVKLLEIIHKFQSYKNIDFTGRLFSFSFLLRAAILDSMTSSGYPIIAFGNNLNFSFPRLRHIKVSNFTSGWEQYCARQETGHSRAVLSILKC